MAPGKVSYPLKLLGFEVVPLATWVDLQEELLRLAKDIAHTHRYTMQSFFAQHMIIRCVQ